MIAPFAVILAGGRGSRLEPWLAPKCLVPIRGVPILDRLLAHLEAQGVPRAVICTGYRAADVEAALRRRNGDMRISFSLAGEDVEMGARLLRAREEYGLDEGRTLVCYGDELSDVDLAAFFEEHTGGGNGVRTRRLLTFAACWQRLPFGVIRNGQIADAEEVLINIGFALAEPECWGVLDVRDGLSTWINRVAALQAAGYYLHEGRRATVNDLHDLRRAEEVWA